MRRNKTSIVEWSKLFEYPHALKILEYQCGVEIRLCIGGIKLTLDEYIGKVRSGEITYIRPKERVGDCDAYLIVNNEKAPVTGLRVVKG